MEKSKINDELSSSSATDEQGQLLIDRKLDELVELLRENSLSNEVLQDLRIKFSEAIHEASSTTALQRYRKEVRRHSHDEDDPELDRLFAISQPQIRQEKQLNIYRLIVRALRILIAVLLVLLGFGMIIMPAPPYFEMFTLFYLNKNDGVTIMDVISLIVAFTGVYIMVSTIAKFKK